MQPSHAVLPFNYILYLAWFDRFVLEFVRVLPLDSRRSDFGIMLQSPFSEMELTMRSVWRWVLGWILAWFHEPFVRPGPHCLFM